MWVLIGSYIIAVFIILPVYIYFKKEEEEFIKKIPIDYNRIMYEKRFSMDTDPLFLIVAPMVHIFISLMCIYELTIYMFRNIDIKIIFNKGDR